MSNPTDRQPELRIVSWPFHNGLRDVSMGRGAARLANDDELRAGVEREGWKVTTRDIDPVEESRPEVARVIELLRRLSAGVRAAATAGVFPLVLAGNCISALGTTAGVGAGDLAGDLGVVWFDAHADFDDPEENESGFFDVMGLAMLTGRGWRALRGTIPGHVAVPEENVILAAVRDLEDYQRRRLEGSNVTAVRGAIDRGEFSAAIAALERRVSRVYLHVDLDALDAAEARANEYAAADGPSLPRLLDCIRLTSERFTIAGAAITSYDPGYDAGDRALAAARAIAAEIARGVRRRHEPPAYAIHPQPTPGTG